MSDNRLRLHYALFFFHMSRNYYSEMFFFRRREFSFFITANVNEDNSPRSPRTQIRHPKALSFTPLGRSSSRSAFFHASELFSHFHGFFCFSPSQVSSSCSSVYVDGSEVRGSSNASVFVKYGTYQGIARFTVWMPEFPLEVSVADFRLSQIKGWKIPEEHGYGLDSVIDFSATQCLFCSVNNKMKRKKRAYNWNHYTDDFANGVGGDRSTCRARYQQSSVDVFAKFIAIDQVNTFQASFPRRFLIGA